MIAEGKTATASKVSCSIDDRQALHRRPQAVWRAQKCLECGAGIFAGMGLCPGSGNIVEAMSGSRTFEVTLECQGSFLCIGEFGIPVMKWVWVVGTATRMVAS